MRVLVIEDDPVLLDGLRVGLGLAGATCDVVSSCGDAEAALATSAFDAVVLDRMLPDGCGLDVLKRLRAAATGRRSCCSQRSTTPLTGSMVSTPAQTIISASRSTSTNSRPESGRSLDVAPAGRARYSPGAT